MKRLREGGGEVDVNMANVLMLLSRGSEGGGGEDESGGGDKAVHASSGRVFECKTCNRKFPSFQALGGHRASHKKPRVLGDGQAAGVSKPRVHECPICGLEFAIGQALGGHMRRHRGMSTDWFPSSSSSPPEEKKVDDDEKKKRGLGLEFDLNLPPPTSPMVEDGADLRLLTFKLGLPMVVNCLH